jgi:hypothetical protein
MDLFVVPTIGFKLLHGFIIVRLHRRNLIWINVTANPTAEWVARLDAPRYVVRDRDGVYGATVARRLRAIGIRDKPTAPASLGQNTVDEGLIGSIRRGWLDHVIVLGERHLRRLLQNYAKYHNKIRTHRSLKKAAPISCAIQWIGSIKSSPVVGGLHHYYFRV